jgi:hypothetical protein
MASDKLTTQKTNIPTFDEVSYYLSRVMAKAPKDKKGRIEYKLFMMSAMMDFELTSVKVAPSRIHGNGVFASVAIKKVR